MAVRQREPCLLVGETGTGKTALVQQLAAQASRLQKRVTCQKSRITNVEQLTNAQYVEAYS